MAPAAQPQVPLLAMISPVETRKIVQRFRDEHRADGVHHAVGGKHLIFWHAMQHRWRRMQRHLAEPHAPSSNGAPGSAGITSGSCNHSAIYLTEAPDPTSFPNIYRGGVANGCAVTRRFTSSGIHVHGFTPFCVNTASPITPTLRVSPWRRLA